MGQASPEWRYEKISEQFHRWERIGRASQIWPHAVALEPPFRPFAGYSLPRAEAKDDGRKHTWISGLLSRIGASANKPAPAEELPPPEEEAEPDLQLPAELVEVQMCVPVTSSVLATQMERFIRHVCPASEPIAFEILGTGEEIVTQWVASAHGAARIQSGLQASFPNQITTTIARDGLSQAWRRSEERFAVVELGLAYEFMLPLENPRCDLISSVVSTMNGLGKEELALLQVIFEPVKAPWANSMLRAVTDHQGKALFDNRPDLAQGVKEKLSSPLFAVVLRLASSAATSGRAWAIVSDMAAALSAMARQSSNVLVPLDDTDYPFEAHEEDILNRLSRRTGIVLSTDELLPLITPPTTSVSKKLRRETRTTNSAPEIVFAGGALSLGTNSHAGETREVFLTAEHRVRHMHLIGASGSGKSTMLLNLIRQDIEGDQGVAVFDPHGDLIDAVIATIPDRRIDDVIVFDPSDEQFPIGFNILAAHSDFERRLLSSDLISIFRRLSTSWGDQMESVLRNAILAFLDSSRGGTLADLRRFLLDAAFRNEFLETISDPEIDFYWTKSFPHLGGGKSIGPVITRLDEFLSQKSIRYIVAQDANRLDFSEIIDQGRILLVRLPQGVIGRENTALLGSLVIAKLQMAAMSRQRMPAAQRRDFWCFMDEFQNFITPSMAEILAGARKYRLGLILAHQELRQLDIDRDVSSAVLSNCFTRAVFKVGDADAKTLESGFSHFVARDLMNLSVGEAVCRVERSDFDFNLVVPPTLTPDETAGDIADAVIASSRTKYARLRSEVEADLARKWQRATESEQKVKKPERPPGKPPEETPPPSAPNETAVPEPTVQDTPPLPDLEKEKSPAPESVEPVPRKQPTETGRGGPLHLDTQKRIKMVAEELGFTAEKEKQVGNCRIDLLLEREGYRIAVEFRSTSGVLNELQNVLKSLAGDFTHIALLSTDTRILEEVRERLTGTVSESSLARIGFYEVEAFLDYVRALPQKSAEKPPRSPKPKKPTKRKVGGWTVTSETAPLSADEQEQAKTRMLKRLGEALKPKKDD